MSFEYHSWQRKWAGFMMHFSLQHRSRLGEIEKRIVHEKSNQSPRTSLGPGVDITPQPPPSSHLILSALPYCIRECIHELYALGAFRRNIAYAFSRKKQISQSKTKIKPTPLSRVWPWRDFHFLLANQDAAATWKLSSGLYHQGRGFSTHYHSRQ